MLRVVENNEIKNVDLPGPSTENGKFLVKQWVWRGLDPTCTLTPGVQQQWLLEGRQGKSNRVIY